MFFKDWIELFRSACTSSLPDQIKDPYIKKLISIQDSIKVDFDNAPPGVKIASIRAEFPLTISGACAIAMLCDRPGTIMMYLKYIEWFTKNSPNWTNPVTSNMIFDHFETGIPSIEDLETLWDLQKLPNGRNAVDLSYEKLIKL